MKKCKNCKTVFKPKKSTQKYCENPACKEIETNIRINTMESKVNWAYGKVRIMWFFWIIGLILGIVSGLITAIAFGKW